jgi:hypothetical protein
MGPYNFNIFFFKVNNDKYFFFEILKIFKCLMSDKIETEKIKKNSKKNE